MVLPFEMQFANCQIIEIHELIWYIKHSEMNVKNTGTLSKCHLTSTGIPIMKIRWCRDCLYSGNDNVWKKVLYVEMGSWAQ